MFKKLSTNQILLIKLLAEVKKVFLNQIALQNLIFLIQLNGWEKEIETFHYDFFKGNLGASSFDFKNDLNELLLMGCIKVRHNPGDIPIFIVTTIGSKFLKRKENSLEKQIAIIKDCVDQYNSLSLYDLLVSVHTKTQNVELGYLLNRNVRRNSKEDHVFESSNGLLAEYQT